MNIALWTAQIILALIYGGAGFLKFFMTPRAMQSFAWAKRHSPGFVRMVGAFELLGALGMFLPLLTGILPWLTPVAAIGLALIQVLAIATEHLPNHELKDVPKNVVLLLLALFVAVGRFLPA